MSTTNAALSQLIAVDPTKKWVIEFEAKIGDGNTDLTVVLYPAQRGDSFRVQLVTDSLGMGKVVLSAPYQPDAVALTPFPMIESQNVAVRFEYYDDPNLTTSFSGVFVNGVLALDTTSIITSRWGTATEAQVILRNGSTGDAYTSSFQSVVVGSTDTGSSIGTNPVTIFDPNDPYSENVVLYLDFEGGDGNVVSSSNSTAILDKSSYTHDIQVNSDAGGIVSLVADNYAPVSTKSASFVTQTGATFLQAAGGSELDLTGVTKWTIEAMVKLPAIGADMIIVDKDGSYGLHESSYQMGIAADGTVWISLQHYDQRSGEWTLRSTLTVPLNEWVHIAAVRDGNNYHLFVNGTGVSGTTSFELTGAGGTTSVQIGAMLYSAAWHALEFKGEMDNLRITSGVARYTSDFSIAYPADNGSNTATITAPTSGGTLTGSTAHIVVGYTTIASSTGVSSVDLYIDKTDTSGTPDHTQTLTTPLKSGSVSFSIDSTLLANGNHTVIAVTHHTDGSSTVSTASSLVTFAVNNIEILPVVTITAPAGGSTVNDIVKIEVTATTANLLAPTTGHINGIDHVVLTIDGVAHTLQPTPAYFYNWDTTNVALGAHTLTATATDTRGNSASTTISLTVAAPDAPSVAFTAPTSGATVSGTTSVAVTASDIVGLAKVDLYVDAILLRSITSAPFTYNWSTLNVGDGAHTLKAVATNVIGVSTTVFQPVTVKNAPTVTIVTPTANYVAVGTISVLATAVAPSGSTIQSVTFLADGAPFAVANSAPYVVTLDSTLLSNTGHLLTAIATTSSSVTGISPGVSIIANNVTVTPVEPTPTTPTITFAAPAANATVGGNVDFTLTVGAPLGVDHITVTRNGTFFARVTHYPYDFSWNSKEVVDGNYTFAATVTDAGGQTATASLALKVRNGIGASGQIPGDPYWSNVTLLLQSKETLGGSELNDSSDYRHQIFANSAGLSNDRQIFGDDAIVFRASQTPSVKTDSDVSLVVNEDFTYESWTYLQASDQLINLLQLGSNELGVFSIYLKNTGVYIKNGSNDAVYMGGTVPTKSWQHVVVQRSSGTITAYVGGKLLTGLAKITGDLGGTGSVVIGSTDGTGSATPFFMDEIRFTNGVARYNGNFNVPTTEFPDYGITDSYWPHVTLMMHTLGEVGSNRFRDYSEHPARISPQGPVQIAASPDSPGEVAAKFNGQTTGLASTRTAAAAMAQFTLEAFINPIGNLPSRIISAQSALSPANVLALQLNADGSLTALLGAGNSENQFSLHTAAGVVKMDGSTRQHVALTRDNTGVVSLWVQGNMVASQSCTITLTNLPVYKVGSYDGTSLFYQGLIDEVRVTEGVTRYTGTFTPYNGLAPTLKAAFALESFYSLIQDHIV
jgi:hypothetical protein